MFFFGWHEKGLLSFVSERVNLVYRINNTRLAFQTSITTIYRLQTSELKSISKFQLLFHWKNFEKIIFYLEAGETELINDEIQALYHSR